jgi:hypothetical protein
MGIVPIQANDGMIDYVHPELNEEITAIGGHYVLTQEIRMPFQRKSLLYIVGHAVFDTSCCGVGGCGYVLVPGFILKWKYKKTESGHSVSRLKPIRNQTIQRDVKRLIEKREIVHQVQFP